MGQGSPLNDVSISFTDLKTLVASSVKYWPREVGQRIYFSWQKKPRAVSTFEVGGGARAWVCENNGHPVNQEPASVKFDDIPLTEIADDFFVWDEGGEPMVLLRFPPSVPLNDAKPEPSDVWEDDGRICAFWQAPAGERKIAFRVGEPVASLASNIKYWRARTTRQEAQGLIAHPVIAGIILLIATISASILLAFSLGQAAAAAWVGAGGTVLALVSSLVLPQIHSRRPNAYKSRPLPD